MSASFIIPAYNEEVNIGSTIESIRREADQVFPRYEIIVADHGSTDETVSIARNHGANVIDCSDEKTIASLRNRAAEHASYDLYVFLDADVLLKDGWGSNLETWFIDLEKREIITGAHVFPPSGNRSYLHRYWFYSFATDPRNTHIGSAHLIVKAETFKRLSGFNDSLITGEDYEFCERARKNGVEIVPNHLLIVEHPDFPDTIQNFIKREIWHAIGDYSGFKSCLESKVVIGTFIFVFLHVVLLISIVFTDMQLLVASMATLFTLTLSSSFYKFSHSGIKCVLINAVIFYFYYFGRSLGFLFLIFKRGKR